MTRVLCLLTTAFLALLALIIAPTAGAATAQSAAYSSKDVIVRDTHARAAYLVQLRARESVKTGLRRLRARPDVKWARPNYVAHASYVPDDPAFARQWNLQAGFGINMPLAWDYARQLQAPGGTGTVVAVLDTGVAYQGYKGFERAPDLAHFARGYDFVDHDSHPNDENGHGTHVAGTIAQTTNNDVETAGIAYRTRIMPVRVLDAVGDSKDSNDIARGIRWAADHGADVINMSLEFDPQVRASDIPDIMAAIRYAHREGVVMVAAAGNLAQPQVAYPGRAPSVIAVGATTIRGCEAEYADSGTDLDIVAPGGGRDARLRANPYDRANCRPSLSGPPIYQQTFTGRGVRRFGLPGGYEGTSMAAAHVSGVAAMLIASRRTGVIQDPRRIERRLESTARDGGARGFDRRYGHGLLDAAAALAPADAG